MAVECVAPPDRADNASRVWIEKQLVRIETMAFLGSIGAMHAVAVQKTRPRLGQISVPDHVRSFLQRQPLELPSAARIEHDEVYGGRMRARKRARATPGLPRRPGTPEAGARAWPLTPPRGRAARRPPARPGSSGGSTARQLPPIG